MIMQMTYEYNLGYMCVCVLWLFSIFGNCIITLQH